MRVFVLCAAPVPHAPGCGPAADFPAPVEGDFVVRDFRFSSGETLPALKLHYRTIGTPRKDASGVVRNAVLILHGTGGSGAGFLSQTFGGELFGSGQLLDADALFHHPAGRHRPRQVEQAERRPAREVSRNTPTTTWCGRSTRCSSEGLEGRRTCGSCSAPRWARCTAGSGARCIPTSSTAWCRWPARRPQIAGRNRVMRKMIMDSITQDPAWKNGDYTEPPRQGLTGAVNLLMMMTSSPLQWHKSGATRDAADKWYRIRSRLASRATDANDMLYQFNASRDYDPSPNLDEDHRRGAGHQLRRRCGEPAGAGVDGEADAAREARALHPDPDQRPDARPRHALAAGDLGQAARGVHERIDAAADE